MLHRSLKFIGAEPNDCVQFPDNHSNFQVIQLDSRPPKNIEMSEEKIICLIAPRRLPSFTTFSRQSEMGLKVFIEMSLISWHILFYRNPKST